jgi:hypothetical protein
MAILNRCLRPLRNWIDPKRKWHKAIKEAVPLVTRVRLVAKDIEEKSL